MEGKGVDGRTKVKWIIESNGGKGGLGEFG
jgi:hypothetical protein